MQWVLPQCHYSVLSGDVKETKSYITSFTLKTQNGTKKRKIWTKRRKMWTKKRKINMENAKYPKMVFEIQNVNF